MKYLIMYLNKPLKMLVMPIKDSLMDYQINHDLRVDEKSKKSFYNDNCKLKVKEGKLVNIEKVGWIKTNEQLPIGVKYSNPRISHDNKYWYISVGIEQEQIKEDLTDVSLGIDLGLKNLAICSDGTVFTKYK